MINNSAAY